MFKKVLPVVTLVGLLLIASRFFVGVSHGDVNINNVGNVQINSTTQCNTGNNTVAGQNSGVVTNSSATTGNANCGSNVQTQVNTNTVIVGNSPTPTVDPCADKPCATPTPTSNNPSTPGNGQSDGRSDGGSSCPQCTQSPHGPAVLGASTFAGTGTFENTIMNLMLVAGIVVLTAGSLSYAKEKNK